jgi:DnaD/phage-associated family protein
MSADETLDEIAEIEPLSAMMWPWFLTYFDDWGRAKASPREIKNSVFQANPLVTIDLIKKTLQLYNPKLIRLYEVDGKWYMCIPSEKWFKFQTHIRSSKRETDASKIPAPPDVTPDNDNSAQMREVARGIAEVAASARDCTPSPSPSPSLSPSPSKTNDDYDNRHSRQNVFGMFEAEIGQLTPMVREKLISWEEDYGELWVKKAIENAAISSQDKRNIKYIEGTLRNWEKTGHPEPWTLDKPHQQRSASVTPLNRTKTGKPSPQVAKGTPAQMSDEELARIRSLARKLQEG